MHNSNSKPKPPPTQGARLVDHQLKEMLRHPGWGLLQTYLHKRLELAEAQCLILDPQVHQSEICRRQGEAKFIKTLLTDDLDESEKVFLLLHQYSG